MMTNLVQVQRMERGIKFLADKIRNLLQTDIKYMCRKMATLVEHLNINKAIFIGAQAYIFTQIAELLDLGIAAAGDAADINDRILIVCQEPSELNNVVKLVRQSGATPVAALAPIKDTRVEYLVPVYSLFTNDEGGLQSTLPLYPMIEYACQSPKDTRTVVMCHPSAYSLASDIIDHNPSQYRYGYISWEHFGDTYPNIQFDTNLKDRDVIFVMSMHDPGLFMEQLSVIIVLPRQQVRSLRIMMSYFAPGTMDHVDTEGTVATAETVATMFSCVPQTKTGPPILEIYDIHALQERFYFKDNVIVELKSAMPLVQKEYGYDWVIVFPDDGAAKRFGPMFVNYTKIVCSKVRKDRERKIVIKDIIGPSMQPLQPEQPQKFLIVDDLVQTGETLIKCAELLKATYIGCLVHTFVTHAVFPKHSYRRFMRGSKDACAVDKFVCTNSNPFMSDILARIEEFKVLRLVEPTPLGDRTDRTWPIYVGSCNKDKLQAVSEAYPFTHRIFGIDVPSGVHAQPVNDETLIGCKNRYREVCMEAPKYVGTANGFIAVSLENGIFECDGQMEDRCIICYNGRSPIVSGSVAVPADIVALSKASGYTKTCGSLLEETKGLEPGTWHQYLSGRSRTEIMSSAIKRYLVSSASTSAQ